MPRASSNEPNLSSTKIQNSIALMRFILFSLPFDPYSHLFSPLPVRHIPGQHTCNNFFLFFFLKKNPQLYAVQFHQFCLSKSRWKKFEIEGRMEEEL